MSESHKDDLTEKFFALIGPGMTVLDLGAGIGRYARRMAERAIRVTAVDDRIDDPKIDGVAWHKGDLRDWLASGAGEKEYDAMFLRNVIQFLPREYVLKTLLPELVSHLRPGGVLAIQTFPRDPEPPFPAPFAFTSFWALRELQDALVDMEAVYARQFQAERESLRGTDHLFFLTDLIVRKPYADTVQ